MLVASCTLGHVHIHGPIVFFKKNLLYMSGEAMRMN